MAKYYTNTEELTSVADAIRTKGGTSTALSYPSGFVSAINALPVSSNSNVSGDVIFIDYDGTVIATKTKAEINAMTSDSDLPANPTHTGLTAQGWNWTVAQLKAQLTAMPDQKVYVGQMYVTTSGDTEIDVVMPEGRLSPIMSLSVNGTVTVDWGDNTTPDTVTGSSLTTRLSVGPHTYASAGNYTIKISVTSGKAALNCTAYVPILYKNSTRNENRVYASTVKSIRIGTDIEIMDKAFYNCSSLSSITIPSSITSIGEMAFYACYHLPSITIPSDVTNIRDYTFNACCSLSSIAISNNVTNIGSSAFYYCYSLPDITITNNVTSVGTYAFYYCSSLPDITIPNSVTSIGTYAFSTCYSLFSIAISSNITSIGNNAFQNCYSLSSITIPSDVTSIGNNAFYYCYSLTNITIPSDMTSIGSEAFNSCFSLSSITIPSSVTSIGNNAFTSCYGMKEYHFQSTSVPTAGTTIFNSIVSDCIIYVPYSSDHSILEAYKTANNWSTYATYMQEEPQS